MMVTPPTPLVTRQRHVARCWTAAAAVLVETLLRVRSLPQTCRLLGIELGGGGAPASPHEAPSPDHLHRVRHDVEWVYSRLGLPDTCLRRSLTAGFRLRAHCPRLVIGVRKTAALEAHAWLVTSGSVIDWAETHDQYVAIH